MPRKNRGVHTSPETAGIKNMPEDYAEKHKDPTGSMMKLMPIWEHMSQVRQDYKGQWTEESLTDEINAYFEYCFTNEVKPCKAGLSIWLDIVKSTYWEWENNPTKYGFKSNLLVKASSIMEMSYVDRLESYPTGNIFLLKTSHGHAETSKVEITNNGQASADEIKDTISKLGLDK